jgi:tocopherol O-methyltransferase
MEAEKIIEYYDTCENDYRLLWDLNKSLAMHAGYWDDETCNLSQALQKQNEVMAELVEIKRGEKVLDAGCGVGGSVIFLAEQYGCIVSGITISKKQVETCKMNAQKRNTTPCPEFHAMDFNKTIFPDNHFDVIWCIESVCHAKCKKVFLHEAHRILKPGGRIIIADAFISKDNISSNERSMMQKWLSGWGVGSLDTISQFENNFIENNFENVDFKDITTNVMPSSRRLFLYSLPAFIFSKIGEFFGARTSMQTANIKSAYYQYITLKKEVWKYGIFKASKLHRI